MEAFFFLVCGFSCVVCLAIAWLVTRKKHREPPRAAAAAAAEPVWCALGTAPPIAIEKLFKVAENGFKVRLSRGPAAVAARRGGVLDRCRALNRALDLDCYDPTGSAARLWGVSRARPFASAAGAILEATRSELVVGADVRFEGEAGYDAGGVVRDWCSGAAAEIVGTAGMLRPLSDGTLMLAPPPPKDGASWLDDADGGRAASLGDPAALEVDLGDYRCSPTKGPLPMSVAKAKRLEFSMSRPERLARVMAFGRLAGAVLAWSARSLAATMGEADEGAAPTLGVPLARALAKLVVGDDIDASDVRALDPELYESRIGVVTRPGGIDALRAALGLGDDPLTFSWYDPGQEKGDSTSLQRGCSRSNFQKKSIHSLSSPREMIARPKMSQNE